MIYEISREVAASLKARGCPFPVIYGPEPRGPTAAGFARSRIVFERDRARGDNSAPARSEHRNPKMHGIRALGAVVRIFAAATKVGSTLHDHEFIADQAADLSIVAIRKTVSAMQTLLSWGPAGFLSADALNLHGLGEWPGVVYELRFAVDRGIYDRTWQGDAEPNQDTWKLASRTVVGAETACGA